MNSPARVLHLIETAQPQIAGFSKILEPLIRGIDKNKFELHIWILGEDGPVRARLEDAGAKVKVISWTRSLLNDPRGAWHFYGSLRRESFDIIHQHFGGGRGVRMIARLGSSARLLVHLHGVAFLGPGEHLALPFADAAIANSRAIAACANGYRPKVVYAGTELPDYEAGKAPFERSGELRVLGMAGRMVAIKGFDHMIRAFGKLRLEFPQLRLEIAGDGAERAPLEDLAADLKLPINFLGWREDMIQVMQGWDIFIQPSLEEGFGLAALEAMACGLPVIASAVRGLPELVQEGETGHLIPPANEEALQSAVEKLILNPEGARRMGIAGRRRVAANFSVPQMVMTMESVYDGLLSPRRQAA